MKQNITLVVFSLLFYTFSFAQSYDITWANIINATTDGNTITKVGANGYNSGASSSNELDADTDGWVEMTVSQVDKHRFLGLAKADLSLSFRDVDFSIFLLSNKHFRVYEKTAYIGDFGLYNVGDTFKLERIGNQIHYIKNGVTFYTSSTPSSSALIVDATLYHSGASLNNVVSSFPADTDEETTSITESLWTDQSTQINYGGKVLIGSDTTAIPGPYNLYVTKGIMTEEVKVALTSGQWSDFVFEKDYIRNSAEYVADFIEKNKHLPNVPSAKEIGEEGINLGQMDAILLRQIEELWLHVIELKRENELLKQQNKKRKKICLLYTSPSPRDRG